ncbi:MAG TPA: GAF domain-containing protein [Actinomycetota bacterium]
MDELVAPDAQTGVAGADGDDLGILLDVIGSVSSASSETEALNRLAWLALRASGADRCGILACTQEDPAQLRPAAGASRAAQDLGVLWDRFSHMQPVMLTDEIRRRLRSAPSMRAISDVQASTLIPEAWKREFASRSIAFAPLDAGGDLIGLLAVEFAEEKHTFSVQETRLLDAIASAAGIALRTSNLVHRLRHAVDVERRLRESAAAVRSQRPIAEMLDVVADRFVSLLPGVSCAIVVLSADGSTLTPVAVRGEGSREPITVAELPHGDVADITRTWTSDPHAPILIPNLRNRTGWQGVIAPGIGTAMLLPLPEGNEIRGIVAVGRESRPFTGEELGLAKAFADHAALAITQARLTEALQLRLRLNDALYRLGDTVGRTRDVRSLLETINREIGSVLDIECTRLCFGDARLAELLRTPVADQRERELLREWRKGKASRRRHDSDLAVCVSLQERAAGVLWVRGSTGDASTLELIGAIASGIGEVALKAKLRRTAERRSQQLAVAKDRERIARDLHDTVGQTLFGIGLKLQDIGYEVEDRELAERVAAVRALAAQGVADVRSAVYALSFLHVRGRGFVPSLRALARQFTLATGVEAQVRLAGSIPSLPDETESALYRVAHEALVNVERHARATGVVIRLTAHPARIEMTIRDDGVGIDQRDGADWRSSAHFGMRAMAKSVTEIGGRFFVSAAQPRGLSIRAVIDLGGTPVRELPRTKVGS